MSGNVRRVELSHVIENGLVTYKGLPAPLICDYLSFEDSHHHYEAGTEFQMGHIDMIGNTGTYVDCPRHRYRDGADFADLPLSSLADLDCLIIRSPANAPNHAVGVENFADLQVAGKAVLIHTGWDGYWGSDRYFEGHAFLTGDAAQLLADKGAKLVGIDSLNIDDTRTGTRPVHSILLGAGIPIVEHLTNLEALPDRGARFTAAPPMIRGTGSFPVRAFAVCPA